ncbi:MAG: NADPH-dependent FMN reductase [Pseudomonadota bacterium]
MKVLSLCGSLRRDSINAALLRAAQRVAPDGITLTCCEAVAVLPLFNPDLEAPAAVRALYADVHDADALLIASPEYAHGVSGTIKNALDWLVSFEPFVHIPVAVFNASPRAHHADDALRETLRTMSAHVAERACLSVPLLGSSLDEDGMVSDAAVVQGLRTALQELHHAFHQSPLARLR